MAWRQASLGFSQKLRQLGDIRRDPPRLVFDLRQSSVT
jgi:hypothetical protein